MHEYFPDCRSLLQMMARHLLTPAGPTVCFPISAVHRSGGFWFQQLSLQKQTCPPVPGHGQQLLLLWHKRRSQIQRVSWPIHTSQLGWGCGLMLLPADLYGLLLVLQFLQCHYITLNAKNCHLASTPKSSVWKVSDEGLTSETSVSVLSFLRCRIYIFITKLLF